MDLGLQNVVTAIDPKTGRKTIDPKTVPGDGEDPSVCPHAGGAKSWIPGSYNPETKTLYVPLVESCMDLIPVRDGGRAASLPAFAGPCARARIATASTGACRRSIC